MRELTELWKKQHMETQMFMRECFAAQVEQMEWIRVIFERYLEWAGKDFRREVMDKQRLFHHLRHMGFRTPAKPNKGAIWLITKDDSWAKPDRRVEEFVRVHCEGMDQDTIKSRTEVYMLGLIDGSASGMTVTSDLISIQQFLDDCVVKTSMPPYVLIKTLVEKHFEWRQDKANDPKKVAALKLKQFSSMLRSMNLTVGHTRDGTALMGMKMTPNRWAARFVHDCLHSEVGAVSTQLEVCECYRSWAKIRGIRMPVSRGELLEVVRRAGFTVTTSSRGAIFQNLMLSLPDSHPTPLQEKAQHQLEDKSIRRFCKERLVNDPMGRVLAKVLHLAYLEWAAPNTAEMLTSNISFGKAMQKLGYGHSHTRDGNAYTGIRILA